MSLLYANSLELTAFSTFFGKPKKGNTQNVTGKRGNNIKYCIQNNIQSCFLEYQHFEEIAYKRRLNFNHNISIDSSDITAGTNHVDTLHQNYDFITIVTSDPLALDCTTLLEDVEKLEENVRKGNTVARTHIIQLLPIYSYLTRYKNMHKIPGFLY